MKVIMPQMLRLAEALPPKEKRPAPNGETHFGTNTGHKIS